MCIISFQFIFRLNNIFNHLECGELTVEKFVREIQKYCNPATPKKILFAWNAMLLDLPKQRISLLKNLKKRYAIFLLSNTNKIHIRKLQELIGEEEYKKFYTLFNKVYYSHEIGFRKPNTESFQLILNENDLMPKKVLFIDDSHQHIQGAEKLGIQTYHLQNNEEITKIFPGIVQ